MNSLTPKSLSMRCAQRKSALVVPAWRNLRRLGGSWEALGRPWDVPGRFGGVLGVGVSTTDRYVMYYKQVVNVLFALQWDSDCHWPSGSIYYPVCFLPPTDPANTI